MSPSRLIRGIAALIMTIGCGHAWAQPKPLTFVSQSPADLPGALTSRWLDGNSFLIAGLDKSVRRFSVTNGSAPQCQLVETYVDAMRHMTLSERARCLYSIDVSPNRDRFIVGGSDLQAAIWKIDSATSFDLEPGASDAIQAISFHRQSGKFIITSGDGVWSWNPTQTNDAPNPRLLGRIPDATTVAVAGQPLMVCGGLKDGRISLTKPDDSNFQEVIRTQAPSTTPVSSIVSAAGDSTLWTCDSRGRLREWDLSLRQPPFSVPASPTNFDDPIVIVAEGRKHLVSAKPGANVRVWKVCPDGKIIELNEFPGPLKDSLLATSANAETIVFAYSQGNVVQLRVSDFLTEPVDLEFPQSGFGSVVSIAVSDDGMRLAISDDQGRIYSRRHRTMGAQWDLVATLPDTNARRRLRFLMQSEVLISADSDGLRAWDCASGKQLAKTVSLANAVAAICSHKNDDGSHKVVVAMLPDPVSAATHFAGFNITFTTSGPLPLIAPVQTWSVAGSGPLVSLSLSVDGTSLLSASGDGWQRIWSLDRSPGVQPELFQAGPAQHTGIAVAWFADPNNNVFALAPGRPLPAWRFVGKTAAQVDRDLPEDLRILRFATPSDSMTPIEIVGVPRSGKADKRVATLYRVSPSQLPVKPVSFTRHDGDVTAACIATGIQLPLNSDGTVALDPCLITASEDRTIRCWNLNTGSFQSSVELPFAARSLIPASFESNDSKSATVAAVLENGQFAIIDFTEAQRPVTLIQQTLRLASGVQCTPTVVKPGADQQSLVFGTSDGQIVVRQSRPLTQFGKPRPTSDPRVSEKESHSGHVYSVAWGAGGNGEVVATATANGSVRRWNATDGSLIDIVRHPNSNDLTLKSADQVALIKTPGFLNDFGETWIAGRETWHTDQPPSTGNPIPAVQFGTGSDQLVAMMAEPVNWPDSQVKTQLVRSRMTAAVESLPIALNPAAAPYRSFSLHAGSGLVAVGSKAGAVIVCDQSGGPFALPLPQASSAKPADPEAVVEGLAFWSGAQAAPGAALSLAGIMRDGQISIWKRAEGSHEWNQTHLHSIPNFVSNSLCTGVSWSTDGRRIAVTAVPKTVTRPTGQAPIPNVWIFELP